LNTTKLKAGSIYPSRPQLINISNFLSPKPICVISKGKQALLHASYFRIRTSINKSRNSILIRTGSCRPSDHLAKHQLDTSQVLGVLGDASRSRYCLNGFLMEALGKMIAGQVGERESRRENLW